MVDPWFNPTSFSPMSAAQFQYSLALYTQSNPAALQQLALLQQFPQLSGAPAFQAPIFAGGPTALLPQPQIDFSGAPAGRGLEKLPESAGWGANAVRDAGGGVWKFGGNGQIDVFKPGAKPGDEAYMRVWGDPHVDLMRDGKLQRVSDFTKDTILRTPWGTTAMIDTTSDTGQSVAQNVRLMNGADSVLVSGVNGQPQVGNISFDGYQQRAALGNLDVLNLGGDARNARLWLERDNKMLGEVSGATQDSQASYHMTYNDQSRFTVDPSMKIDPRQNPVAWGHQLRGEAVDVARRADPAWGGEVAKLMQADHLHGMIVRALGFDPTLLFGGYGGFGGFPQMTQSVPALFEALKYIEINNQLLANARANNPILC